MFFQGRRNSCVVTTDVWSYFRHLNNNLLATDATRANAFLDQAVEFYLAAENPRTASRPLLYYYSFLNLAKIFLLHRSVRLPNKVTHGIADPHLNTTAAITLPHQKIQVSGLAKDDSAVFPLLCRELHVGPSKTFHGDYTIEMLAEEIPAVHRTYTMITGAAERFVHLRRIDTLVSKGRCWTRIELSNSDDSQAKARKNLLARPEFQGIFKRVIAHAPKTELYESKPRKYQGAQFQKVIRGLGDDITSLGVCAIHTPAGFRYYLLDRAPAMPQLCSAYAIMFYLGSITRYKPHDFEKLTASYQWFVNEFIESQPAQFVYQLASTIGKTEVLRPFASGLG